MEHAARVCLHLIDYSASLVADLTDNHCALVPFPAMKSAGWILGHLTVSGDFLRRQWQRPPLTPKEWGPRFGPGTQSSKIAADYPAMETLRATLGAVYNDLAAAAPTISSDTLDRPNPFEAARQPFPTLRDFAVYLMSGHLGYHLGQLSGWRIAAGLPPRSTGP